jgi:hypothetical protein
VYLQTLFTSGVLIISSCEDAPLGRFESRLEHNIKIHVTEVGGKDVNWVELLQDKFAQHILDTQHTYDTIEKTMDILHIEKKGPLLNMWERFYIHNLSVKKLQMNDTYKDTQSYF